MIQGTKSLYAVFIPVPAKITVSVVRFDGTIRYNIYENKALAFHGLDPGIWHANC
jgi:hypothetical protein